MKFLAVLYLLIYLPGLLGNSSMLRCPLYRQYFQKILSFRPAVNTPNDTLYRPNYSNHIGNNTINNNNYYVSLSERPSTLAINIECWQKCKDDIECSGYVLFFNASVCYGFTKSEKARRHLTQLLNDSLVQDSSAVYFEKICLNNVPANYKAKLWLFTKIPGSNMVYHGRKTLSMLVSRSRCAEECLLEKEFQCLSASYITSHRNNYVRFDQNSQTGDTDPLGTCILSAKDKSIQPDAFRVSSIDEEYIENQCADRGTENDNCSYEVHKNSRLIYADAEYRNTTQLECKEKCALETRFFCQGISHYDSRSGYTRCLVHSEDVISLGPRSLLTDRQYTYMRRVRCLNVTVVCSKSEMTINYSPYDSFIGRMYVSTHSEERSSVGKGYRPVMLKLPIGNESQEKRSGIIRAYQVEGHSSINRTLLSTHVVIQTNPIVQTQGDRLIKVGCIIDNNMSENGTIGDIALGSSLVISHRNPTNDGTQVLNSTGTAPRVTMRVVDMAEHTQINDVSLGQNLELQINLDPPDSLYDIRAVQLIARSDTGHSSIMLLDKRGCPTDQTVFPALEKLRTNSTHLLYGRFHAFKFAGSSYVNFDVIIQFCMNECEPINCGHGVRSNGRRRKRSISNRLDDNDQLWPHPEATFLAGSIGAGLHGDRYSHEIRPNQSVSIDNVYRVDTDSVVSQRVLGNIAQEIIDANVAETSRTHFTDNKRVLKELIEVPLQLQLNVRVPEAVADSESLIYGENNQILLAGVDQFTAENMVCINQTLLILLLLLWIVLQTILMASCCIFLRRYKRMANGDDDRTSLQKIHQNLEFENRRVHWADQGRSHVMMFT